MLLRTQHIQLNSLSWSTTWTTVTVRCPGSVLAGGSIQISGNYSITAANRLTVSAWDLTSNFVYGPFLLRGRPACATLIPGDHVTLPTMTVTGVPPGNTYFIVFEIIPDFQRNKSTVSIGMIFNLWFDVTGLF